jgi:hypothetical protein
MIRFHNEDKGAFDHAMGPVKGFSPMVPNFSDVSKPS